MISGCSYIDEVVLSGFVADGSNNPVDGATVTPMHHDEEVDSCKSGNDGKWSLTTEILNPVYDQTDNGKSYLNQEFNPLQIRIETHNKVFSLKPIVAKPRSGKPFAFVFAAMDLTVVEVE